MKSVHMPLSAFTHATLLYLFSLFVSLPASSIANQSDSLLQVLSNASSTERLIILEQLTNLHLENDPAEALLFARTYYEEAMNAKDLAKAAAAVKLRADAQYFLADYHAAMKDYILSAELVEKVHGKKHPDYITRLGDIGYCYKMLNDYGNAVIYYKDALEWAVKTDLKSEMATNYNNLGQIFTDWGEYGMAAEHFHQTLMIDKDSGDEEFLSTTLNNLGKVYELWGKYDQALDYYQEALAIDKARDDQMRIAIRLNNIGAVYQNQDSLDKALDYFNQALVIERALGDHIKIGRRLAYIGDTWFRKGEYAIARGFFQQARPLIEGSGTPYDKARLYMNLAHDRLVQKAYMDAVDLLEQSNAIASAHGLKPLLINNFKTLSEVYTQASDPQKALENYKKYIEIKEAVFSTESDKRLSIYQSLYSNEKIRYENEVLHAQADLRKKNLVLLYVLLALTLSVATAMIIILRFRGKSLRQQRIIAEREAENLKKDLELKNNELTYNAMCIVQTNEAISKMGEMIREMMQSNQSVDQMNMVLDQLRSIKNDKAWQEFELRFTQVHSDFYERLQTAYPDLTPNEKKLCAFLRLNMTTKDIAAITHQSVHSINVARTRLRKKMNLSNSEENLVNYLMAF